MSSCSSCSSSSPATQLIQQMLKQSLSPIQNKPGNTAAQPNTTQQGDLHTSGTRARTLNITA